MNHEKAPPLVKVVWEDATVLDDAAWSDEKEHKYKAQYFTSVGYLLYDGKEGIILTGSWSEEMVAARDQIPRGMVRSVKRLKP